RVLRESLNISQTKLAEICGSNQSSINRYEHGQAEAPYRILLWYADYFDVSLDYIFGRTDKPEGVKFDNQPIALKRKISNTDEFRDFIEACFDPRSPMNAKLKEFMIKMAEEGDD
ncbi:MAG: helix-turn-helix transcriptional regulator, partial [Oscillospiraceae bacterium]|nr:helix-turn-helix transcriptional regulator [Oscillospiraceae bacterium]